MLKYGYPSYTTSCAWLGYPDHSLKQVCFFHIILISALRCTNMHKKIIELALGGNSKSKLYCKW